MPNCSIFFLVQFGSAVRRPSTMAPRALLLLALLSLLDANEAPPSLRGTGRNGRNGHKEVNGSSEVPDTVANNISLSNVSVRKFGPLDEPLECCGICMCRDYTWTCTVCEASDLDYSTCCFPPINAPKPEEFRWQRPYIDIPKPPYYISTPRVTSP